jgi:hypothetical protein
MIFSAPMVRALLAGTKTQTRRVVKPQPDSPFHSTSGAWVDMGAGCIRAIRFPYGDVGDQIWVRETWFSPPKPHRDLIGYAADVDFPPGQSYRKQSSMFMPRSHSRITLEITDLRVERVQDISKDDAEAEGVAPWKDEKIAHVAMYRELWSSLHGPESWGENPYVWVIGFKRCLQSGVDQK